MSAERLETLTRIYEGWEHGDFTVGVGLFDQNAVLVMDPELPDAGVHVGPEGIKAYMIRLLDAWESLTIAAESLEEVGDSVLAKVKQSGTGKGSGAAVGFTYFQLWTFRGKKVIRLESIMHEARALEAAGMGGTPTA